MQVLIKAIAMLVLMTMSWTLVYDRTFHPTSSSPAEKTVTQEVGDAYFQVATIKGKAQIKKPWQVDWITAEVGQMIPMDSLLLLDNESEIELSYKTWSDSKHEEYRIVQMIIREETVLRLNEDTLRKFENSYRNQPRRPVDSKDQPPENDPTKPPQSSVLDINSAWNRIRNVFIPNGKDQKPAEDSFLSLLHKNPIVYAENFNPIDLIQPQGNLYVASPIYPFRIPVRWKDKRNANDYKVILWKFDKENMSKSEFTVVGHSTAIAIPAPGHYRFQVLSPHETWLSSVIYINAKQKNHFEMFPTAQATETRVSAAITLQEPYEGYVVPLAEEFQTLLFKWKLFQILPQQMTLVIENIDSSQAFRFETTVAQRSIRISKGQYWWYVEAKQPDGTLVHSQPRYLRVGEENISKVLSNQLQGKFVLD